MGNYMQDNVGLSPSFHIVLPSQKPFNLSVRPRRRKLKGQPVELVETGTGLSGMYFPLQREDFGHRGFGLMTFGEVMSGSQGGSLHESPDYHESFWRGTRRTRPAARLCSRRTRWSRCTATRGPRSPTSPSPAWRARRCWDGVSSACPYTPARAASERAGGTGVVLRDSFSYRRSASVTLSSERYFVAGRLF